MQRKSGGVFSFPTLALAGGTVSVVAWSLATFSKFVISLPLGPYLLQDTVLFFSQGH